MEPFGTSLADLPPASSFLQGSFLVLTALMVGLFWLWSRSDDPKTRGPVLGFTVWAGAAAAGSVAGLFVFNPVPTLPLVAITGLILTARTAWSPFGSRLARELPLWALVGYQSFRIPVELLLHRSAVEGLLPYVMTYEGWNMDILSGASALLLALIIWFRGSVPKPVLFVWNVASLGILATVVAVAMLSGPSPFRQIFVEPSTVVVTGFPWVWLPTILVPMAIFGHLLMFRRLRTES